MGDPIPARGAPVELVEITGANYRDAFRLKVRPEQERFVAGNAVSIAHARTRPRGEGHVPELRGGPGGPEAFYRRLGFERTGEVDEGEQVMRLSF